MNEIVKRNLEAYYEALYDESGESDVFTVADIAMIIVPQLEAELKRIKSEKEEVEGNYDTLYKVVDRMIYDFSNQWSGGNDEMLDDFLKGVRKIMCK